MNIDRSHQIELGCYKQVSDEYSNYPGKTILKGKFFIGKANQEHDLMQQIHRQIGLNSLVRRNKLHR